MIACPSCHTVQPARMVNTGALFNCHACRAQLRMDVFNAFLRPLNQGPVGENIQEQGQAECFYHRGKKALVPCAACGRLLCALCRVELEGRSLCLNCLQSGLKKQTIIQLETKRTLYDSLALNLAFWPMLFVFPTLLTAPAAAYLALRHWKSAPRILPRSHLRHVLALLLAGVQMAGWVVFFARIWS